MSKFIFLEHTADVKFQAFGDNLEELFTNSILAVKQAIAGKTKIKKVKEKKIEVAGKDYESLMYNLLEEIIYFVDADDFTINDVKEIKLRGFKISAVITGDKASNYKFTNNIKAVTYSEMFIKKEESLKKRWICQVVLDA